MPTRWFRHLLPTALLLALATLSLLAGDAFTLVQLADPQLGMGEKGYAQDLATLRRAVVQINALRPAPECVVICGDLVNAWTPAAAGDVAQAAASLSMPWYVAPGNHDAWKSDEYRKLFGADQQSVNLPHATLVLINTNLWKTGTAAESDAATRWLETALAAAAVRKLPIFVVGHIPLFVKTAEERAENTNLAPVTRRPLLALLAKYRVAAYLAGHIHMNAVASYEGIPMVADGSTAKNFSAEPLGFRLWHIDGQGVITHEWTQVVPAAEPAPTPGPTGPR